MTLFNAFIRLYYGLQQSGGHKGLWAWLTGKR